ncbi:hypothetical protein [Agrobacterium sp. NPDC089420]|uniref:hypothetical protein n=1 Tax=Agrobacterium sp. NPDC089420 TaxID=3363918 RepID=UPI0038515143
MKSNGRFFYSFSFIALSSLPNAQAATTESRMLCDQIINRFPGQDRLSIEYKEDGCTVQAGEFDNGAQSGLWSFNGIDIEISRGHETGTFSFYGKIDVTGLALPENHSSGNRYPAWTQKAPIDFRLDFSWHGDLRWLHVEKAEISSGPRDRISFSTDIYTGFQPALQIDQWLDTKKIWIANLALEVENDRLLKDLVVPSVLRWMGEEEAKQTAMEAWKSQLSGSIASLPSQVASRKTRTELQRFISQMPRPSGLWKILFQFNKPQNLEPLALGEISLTDVVLQATIEAIQEP